MVLNEGICPREIRKVLIRITRENPHDAVKNSREHAVEETEIPG